MGERIRAARCFIQIIHKVKPKYSFEHAAANTLFGLACLVLTLLSEHRLWAGLFAVLMISIGVQGLRVWWFIHRQRMLGRSDG